VSAIQIEFLLIYRRNFSQYFACIDHISLKSVIIYSCIDLCWDLIFQSAGKLETNMLPSRSISFAILLLAAKSLSAADMGKIVEAKGNLVGEVVFSETDASEKQTRFAVTAGRQICIFQLALRLVDRDGGKAVAARSPAGTAVLCGNSLQQVQQSKRRIMVEAGSIDLGAVMCRQQRCVLEQAEVRVLVDDISN
jgi:hypothetical protein